MTDDEKKQNIDDWLAEEKARLKKGFAYEPKPSTAPSGSSSADDVLAGLGLGAGVVGGAMAPHPNPVTFEGCQAAVIVGALRAELPADDTRVEVDRTGDAVVVTVLQSQKGSLQFLPAVAVNLVEKGSVLTVTVSELGEDVKRSTLGSVSKTVLDQGRRALFRRRRRGGLMQTAGDLVSGVEDLVEDIQDLTLPRRVWRIINRVGVAAEDAYLEEQGRIEEQKRLREKAERAWTHCPSCGRAYEPPEAERMNCPSCGGARGPKPSWLT